MGRIQGLAESGLLTGNILLKTGAGYVFSITIGYTNVVAGTRLYLRDGLDGIAPIEVVFIVPGTDGTTVHGTIRKEWPQGKEFGTGIYWDEGGAGGADRSFAEITYK